MRANGAWLWGSFWGCCGVPSLVDLSVCLSLKNWGKSTVLMYSTVFFAVACPYYTPWGLPVNLGSIGYPETEADASSDTSL